MSETDKNEVLPPLKGRVPNIPSTYTTPKSTMGQIPAVLASGFEASRCGNTPEAKAKMVSRGFVVAMYGDLNPDNPDEFLVTNQDSFAKTDKGELLYNGDILVISRTDYAAKQREEENRIAHKSADIGIAASKNLVGNPAKGTTMPKDLREFAERRTREEVAAL